MPLNSLTLPTVPTIEDRRHIFEKFEELRVSDVRDGMDACGLRDEGSIHSSIKCISGNRMVGFALTSRYIPYAGSVPSSTGYAYQQWLEEYRSNYPPRPWQSAIRQNDIIVIDQCELAVGILGSRNTLRCIIAGAKGFVTNGGVRDTDDLRDSGIPVWAKENAQSRVEGRVINESCFRPISVGGVMVHNGDLIVADGDGVVVVPFAYTEVVASEARKEAWDDHEIRKALLMQLQKINT